MSIESERVRLLNDGPAKAGRYVLYWMQQAQRESCNHALEYAVERANGAGVSVLVGFGLMDDYPEANLRHYRFMLQGLAETARGLRRRGIGFALRHGHPVAVARELARLATEVVCDRGYLRHQKAWRAQLADDLDCTVAEVETDAVLPLAVISDKAEYAARTIRPRIHRHLEAYLRPVAPRRVEHAFDEQPGDTLDDQDPDRLLDQLALDRSVGPVDPFFVGGHGEARRRLDAFLSGPVNRYADRRSHPEEDVTTQLSPYLHFGQISALEMVLAIRDRSGVRGADRDDFIEELVVRRTLAQNFCEYTQDYDAWSAIPDWARRTLDEHRSDPREHLYDRAELDAADTHDRYWNAAMTEMKVTGFMHNYMRMYWGKKILEWSPSPEQAHAVTLALNNRYFLDGRDPNSYVGVNWIYGVHDRAWTERPVFGKVRYMNANGLKRKFDIEGYVDKVRDLERRAREGG